MKESPVTIKEILEEIDSKTILLPAMQRQFVWSEDKIINLFDSIMKEYPFGEFILWHIENKDKIKKYQFYEFVKEYSKRDNTKHKRAGSIGKDSIYVVLDGQQRLTSLYIAIKGSYETIKKRKHKSINENWKRKKLYIIPSTPIEERDDDNEISWKFCFLDEETVEVKNSITGNDWEKYYPVSDFYNMSKEELREKFDVGQIRKNNEWLNVLDNLRVKLNEAEIIKYDSIGDRNISDILEIFTRINNGGTKLEPIDLLFSYVITSWDEGKDKIIHFIEEINRGEIVKLKEDFVIKTCLYLLNKPASAKLESLTADTIDEIKNNWSKITKAICNTKGFLKRHLYVNEAIRSYNALLPIIYYYFYSGNKVNDKVEKELYLFFAISQLFSLFGANTTNVLETVRKHMCKNEQLGNLKLDFKMSDLYDITLGARINAFKITRDQIKNLVDTTSYGDRKLCALLAFLQPNIKLNGNEYDVDHVVPKKQIKKICRYNRDAKERAEKIENKISNLQLLQYQENRGEKNDADLYRWVIELKYRISFDPYENDLNPGLYKIENIDQFENFFNKRRDLIVNYLCEKLNVKD